MSRNPDLKKTYEELQKAGYATVDNLIKWLQAARIVETTHEAEEKTKKMFEEAERESKSDYEKFSQVLQQMAEQSDRVAAELTQTLASEAPKLMEAFAAAAKAFEETLKKK